MPKAKNKPPEPKPICPVLFGPCDKLGNPVAEPQQGDKFTGHTYRLITCVNHSDAVWQLWKHDAQLTPLNPIKWLNTANIPLTLLAAYKKS